MSVKDRDFLPELKFQTSRSGGKGGQNVNKVETKVELYFPVMESTLLSVEEKHKIIEKLGNKINSDGMLQVTSQEARSQSQNKTIAIGKFYDLLEEALKKQKKRKRTRKPKAAEEQRLKEKKQQSAKKEQRSQDFGEYY